MVHGARCLHDEMRPCCDGRDRPVPSRGQPQRESPVSQAFDEARRGVLLTTRVGTRWDQEPLDASAASCGDDAPCEVPKYALVDPLGANVVAGRVVDAGFSPEPYAAGVPPYISLYLPVSPHISPSRTRRGCPRRSSSSIPPVCISLHLPMSGHISPHLPGAAAAARGGLLAPS